MRGPEPHVTWAGVVVKLNDGTTHAVEFTGSFITADLKLPHLSKVRPDMYSDGVSVWIQGSGRYWQEGADMGPNVAQRELPPGRPELTS